jgi:alkylhydroperoxidase/carboxymuconolactone decarboxylase family protein YurZ
MTELSADQKQLRDEFVDNRGYWNPFWEQVLTLSPEFFKAYSDFSSVPWKTGTLAPKIKEFVYIAIDASTTHLYIPGLRIHIQNALNHGATREEIMEVLQLTSVLGVHTCSEGIPILIEELRNAGKAEDFDAAVLGEREEKLKADFIEARGYWAPFWDQMLKLSPEFFEAYLNFSSVPWRNGVLEPKIKELIYIAIDSATTHLYNAGTRVHLRNALSYGATKEEIMEVFQLTSVIGIHTCTESVPILFEELERAEAKAAE